MPSRWPSGIPDWEIVALDNLHRRGSELNLPRLRAAGVRFVHGDVRDAADLPGSARSTRSSSARPSRRCWPGVDGGAGLRRSHESARRASTASSCARRECAQLVFLSTSRVYPVAALDAARLRRERRPVSSSRRRAAGAGRIASGIAEAFPLDGARTLYGATKLAAELLIAEYAAAFGLRPSSTAAA